MMAILALAAVTKRDYLNICLVSRLAGVCT